MKKITIMGGMPRCGKSTWVNKYKGNAVVVSADDLRYLVYNQRFWKDGEPLVWSIRNIMLKYLMQQGVDIIIDDTNTLRQFRAPVIKMAKEFGYYIVGNMITEVSVDECIERAIITGQDDLVPVIKKMHGQIEHFSGHEGFDEIHFL